MKKIFIIAAGFMFLAGCAQFQFRIEEQTDSITNQKSVVSVNNVMPAGTIGIELNLMIFDKDTKKERSMLSLQYYGHEWLMLSGKSEIIFNADNSVLKLKDIGNGSTGSREVIKGAGGVRMKEVAFFAFDKKVIQKIIDGKIVKGRIQGDKSSVDFEVTAENKTNFKAMLAAVK